LRDEQGESETSQDTLGGATPLGVLLVDVEEFASVGQVVRGESQVIAQLSTDVDLFGGEVAGPLLQAAKFCGHEIAALLEVLLSPDRCGPCRVEFPLLGGEPGTLVGNEGRECGEGDWSVDCVEAGFGDGSVEPEAVLVALFSLGARLSRESLQLADAVASRLRAFFDQRLALVGQALLLVTCLALLVL